VVAIKRISKSLLKEYKMDNQMIQEIKLHMFSNHPSVVQLYTFFDDATYVYLVMEYMPDGTLFSLMHKKGHMEEPEVAYIMLEIGMAVKFAWTSYCTSRY
jgi:serine/threonine protein kinase